MGPEMREILSSPGLAGATFVWIPDKPISKEFV
jgi:hypothetical protein